MDDCCHSSSFTSCTDLVKEWDVIAPSVSLGNELPVTAYMPRQNAEDNSIDQPKESVNSTGSTAYRWHMI
eukprot:14408300-Ditylum_brightwellii.AAC.1